MQNSAELLVSYLDMLFLRLLPRYASFAHSLQPQDVGHENCEGFLACENFLNCKINIREVLLLALDLDLDYIHLFCNHCLLNTSRNYKLNGTASQRRPSSAREQCSTPPTACTSPVATYHHRHFLRIRAIYGQFST